MDFALAEFELRIKQRNRSRSKRLAVLTAAFVRTPDTNSDGAIVAKILVAIIEHDILIEQHFVDENTLLTRQHRLFIHDKLCCDHSLKVLESPETFLFVVVEVPRRER